MVVSLSKPQKIEGKVSLSPKKATRSYQPEELEYRVDQTDYALQEEIPSEQIRLSFELGYEDRLREQAVAREGIKERRQRQNIVSQVAKAFAMEGRTMLPEEREFIMGVSGGQIQRDPNTIIEHLYARRLAEEIINEPENNEIQEEAFNEQTPEENVYTQSAMEDFMAKQQIAMTILDELKSKADATSVLDKGFAMLKGLIPFYTWAQNANRIKVNGGSFFLGANIEDQMRTLYFNDQKNFEAILRAAVEDMSKENTLEALNFASAAVSYSGSDSLWDNVFTGLDTADVATLGVSALATSALKGAKWIRKAKGIVQSSALPGSTTKQARQVLSGNMVGASQTGALNRLQTAGVHAPASSTPTPHANLRALMASGQGLLDPKAYTRNAGSLSAERQARLEEVLQRNANLLVSTQTDISHVGRISDEAAAAGFRLAETEFKTTYPNLEDAIVEVRSIRESEEVFGGVDHIEVLLGKKDATGFSNPTTAENYATKMYRLAPGSFQVMEDSGNYFIRMTKTIDETKLQLADLRLGTNNKAPVTFSNTVLGWLRSNSYLVSKENADWRKVATYGANAVLARMGAVSDQITRLGKNEVERLRVILDDERVRVGSRGKELRTVFDVESEYLKRFGSMPNDTELAAWATYRQLAYYDHIVQNISMFRDKARMGVEQQSVGFSKKAEDADRWSYVNTEFFEGRRVDSLPTTQEPYTVAWVDSQNGRFNFGVSDRMFPEQRQSLEEAVASGNYKIIQPQNPRDPVLKGLLDAKGKPISRGEPVEFVVVKDVKTKPLNPIQIPYSAEYPYHNTNGFFVKQTRSHKTGFGRRVIDGDTVVQRSVSNAEGRELAAAYEEGRRLVKEALASPNPNLQNVTNFVQTHLPFSSAKDFIKQFRGTPYAAADAPFDLDTPFVLTASGQKSGAVRTYDSMFSEELVNLDTSSHNLENRIGGTVSSNRLGTQQKPIIDISAGTSIDPYTVISRSAERIAKARFYDDYVHRSIEDWVNQFGDTLDVAPEVFRANPMRFFQDPVYRKDYNDRAVLSAAKNARRAILTLLGQDTQDSKVWKWMRQKVVDQVFKRRGQNASQIVEPWMFTRNMDPVQISRSSVFHAKLGLFNPVQFPLQGASIVHAAAIDGNPLRAVQAQFAYWGMRMRGLSEVSPRAQGFLSKRVSSALGVPENQLDEMYDAWRRSGMGIVSGEYAALDDYLNPKMFVGKQSAVNKALDVGTFFFKEGNNWHRGTAFATSYLRWRQMNPEARLDNRALRQIVDRADLMYVNMARDSNAGWQKGWPSVASTFFAYHARMAEQLLGKRLTAGEKFRVFATYSAMWGVPIGVAGPVAGVFWPVGDSVKQYMLENGIDGDANIATKVLTEGVADMLVEWATGEDYNVSERFGPNGLSWLRDIIDGEVFEVLQGAPGSFMGDMIKSTSPIVHWTVGVFDGEPGGYELTGADFVDAIRNISTVNNTVKAYQVFTLGQWMTRQDGILKESEKGDVWAAMMAVSGLTPDEISEGYLKIRSNKQWDANKRAVEQSVLVEFERGLKAAREGEVELAETFFKRAHVLMQSADWTPKERGEVFKKAIRVNREMIVDVGEDFVLKDPNKRLGPYTKQYTQNMETK